MKKTVNFTTIKTMKTYLECSDSEKEKLSYIDKNIANYFKEGIFSFKQLKSLEELTIEDYQNGKSIEYLLGLKDWRKYFFQSNVVLSNFIKIKAYKKNFGHLHYDNFELFVKNFLLYRKKIKENNAENILYLLSSVIHGYCYYAWKENNTEIKKKYFQLLQKILKKSQEVFSHNTDYKKIENEYLIKSFIRYLFNHLSNINFDFNKNEDIFLLMKKNFSENLLNVLKSNNYLLKELLEKNWKQKKEILFFILEESENVQKYNLLEIILEMTFENHQNISLKIIVEENEFLHKNFYNFKEKNQLLIIEKLIFLNDINYIEKFYDKNLFLKIKKNMPKPIKEEIDNCIKILDNKKELENKLIKNNINIQKKKI
jgi:hypothetical protein